jgi:uracil-DNA glycosylase family 4
MDKRNPQGIWDGFESQVLKCTLCPRLRDHCQRVATNKRASYAAQTYYGLPVLGFGDRNARLVIVGLAPGAHGANRTGRMFTGDRSGDFLYSALHRAGFASQPSSTDPNDGLILRDCFITAAARCAPPQNRPTREELSACRTFLDWEMGHLVHAQVYVSLGQLAFVQTLKSLAGHGIRPAGPTRLRFAHAAEVPLSGSRLLVASYHPSQQNTFTGRLTEAMFDTVFEKTRSFLSATTIVGLQEAPIQ